MYVYVGQYLFEAFYKWAQYPNNRNVKWNKNNFAPKIKFQNSNFLKLNEMLLIHAMIFEI